MHKIKSLAIASLVAVLPGLAVAASPGDRAPAFTLTDMRSGREVSLDEFQGQVVYLDFWASWCGPCRRSFPFMNGLLEAYGDQGLTVLAVNLDQQRSDAQEFLSENAASFIVVENQAGDVAESYGVIAMPSTYIIDRDGRIAEVHHGFKSEHEADLRSSIVGLL